MTRHLRHLRLIALNAAIKEASAQSIEFQDNRHVLDTLDGLKIVTDAGYNDCCVASFNCGDEL